MRAWLACLVAGCATLPADGLATFKGSVESVVADGASVYVATNLETIAASPGSGKTMTLVPDVGTSGSNAATTIAGGTADWLFMSNDNVSTLLEVPTAGGSPRTVATLSLAQFPWAMTSDADNVYLLSTQDVWRVSKSDGSAVALAHSDSSAWPGGIAVDGTSVYWSAAGNTPMYSGQYVNDGVVMSVPIAGGPAQTLASTQAYPVGVTVDEANVYWMVGDPAGVTCTPACVPGAIMRCPIGSASPTVLMTLGGPAAPPLVVSDGFLYWISILADGSSADIVRAPVAGGTPEVVVAASEGVDSQVKFAVDATRIYWAGAAMPGDYLHWKPK